MSNKGKYKVPKAHALWPILWRTVLFIAVISLIFAVLNILAEYVKDFRSEADKEYVRTIATMVDTGTAEERQSNLNILEDDDHAYCIIDLDGKVVETSGGITISGYNQKTGEFSAGMLNDILDESDVKEKDIDHVKTLVIDDMDTSSKAIKEAYNLARTDPNFLKGTSKAVLTFPYWIAAPMNESEQILLVKSDLTVNTVVCIDPVNG